MSKCAVRRGFFVLRDCLAPTDEACTVCGRTCCPEHRRVRSEDDPAVLCIECHAKDVSVEGGPSMEDDPTRWAFSYRSFFYTSSRYRPFYSGSRRDRYYDDYDVRAFESDLTDDFDDGDHDLDDSGGFFDS